jgi:hypothetical protein
MKRLVKVPAVAAVILTLAMVDISSARAGGWTVAAGVVGGFAAGTIVGRAVANYPPPSAYYVYPQRVYVAPLCAPASGIVQPAPDCYATAPVVYPFYDPPIRLGGFTGRPHYFRRWWGDLLGQQAFGQGRTPIQTACSPDSPGASAERLQSWPDPCSAAKLSRNLSMSPR